MRWRKGGRWGGKGLGKKLSGGVGREGRGVEE